MKVETYLVLNRDEINQQIPYALVCEIMGSARWSTTRRIRLMSEQFTDTERDAISRIYHQARIWYLIKGVPDELRITPHILELWYKLAAFCCEL